MPMIDLTLLKGRFDRPEQEALAAELTRLIIHWESGTDRPGYDKAAWAFVSEVELIEVGGRPSARSAAALPRGGERAQRFLDDQAGLMNDVASGDERWDELRFDQR